MSERRKIKLGITGGIACGKSSSAKILEELGWSIIDADHIAHRLLASDSPIFSSLVDHFGVDIVGADGEVNRSALGQLVFSNECELEKLNDLVHPQVHKEWKGWLEDQQGLCAVVIPLLYETGSEKDFDQIVCVAAPEDMILERLSDRGLTPKESADRIAAQMPLKEKIARADIVIVNDGNLMELKEKLYEVHHRLEHKEKQQNG